MSTRRAFLHSIPAVGLAGFGTGLAASVGYAQGRIRPTPVDPMVDAVSHELCLALRERPSGATLQLVTRVFARVAETSGLAARIDALVARPEIVTQVFDALNDHAKHAEDRALAQAFAPNLPPMQMRPPASIYDVSRAVEQFRSHGFANSLRQMAEALPGDDRPQPLDCWGMWYGCLIWQVATIFVCLIPSGAGCLLGYLIDAWICSIWYYCEP